MWDTSMSENYRHCRGLPNVNGRLFVLLERPMVFTEKDEWYLQNIITNSFIVATTLSKWLKILQIKTCDKVTCFGLLYQIHIIRAVQVL